MIKTLEKYVLTEFFKLLAIALVSFIVLFLAVDLFENVDDIMAGGASLVEGLLFFACKVPFMVSQVSPVAVLLAVLLAMGIFTKHNEITAVKAGGVSLARVLAPLLAAGLAISLAVILMNETLTPAALKKAETLEREWAAGVKGSFGRTGLWIRTDRGIYNLRKLDPAEGTARGLTFYRLTEPFDSDSHVHAKAARWDGARWLAPAAEVWTLEGMSGSVELERYAFTDLPAPGSLATIERARENMGFTELRRYIKKLESEGYDASRYRVDLYSRITFPMVSFIMVLVGVPFALKTGRHGGIASGVALSVIIGFSYWIVFAVTKTLGQNGALPPIVAATFPDVLFLAAGVLMYGFVRK